MMLSSYVNAPGPGDPVYSPGGEASVGGVIGGVLGLAAGPVVGKVCSFALGGIGKGLSKAAGAAGRGLSKAAGATGRGIKKAAKSAKRSKSSTPAPKGRGGAAQASGGLKLRPDIALSGGRGGQLVKTLTGPANSVIKGSNGRIFITDDAGKVIWDITKTRAKPVVPGRGFGKKTLPTQEQLDLINKIWGN